MIESEWAWFLILKMNGSSAHMFYERITIRISKYGCYQGTPPYFLAVLKRTSFVNACSIVFEIGLISKR